LQLIDKNYRHEDLVAECRSIAASGTKDETRQNQKAGRPRGSHPRRRSISTDFDWTPICHSAPGRRTSPILPLDTAARALHGAKCDGDAPFADTAVGAVCHRTARWLRAVARTVGPSSDSVIPMALLGSTHLAHTTGLTRLRRSHQPNNP
jgi:hypothetical protein